MIERSPIIFLVNLLKIVLSKTPIYTENVLVTVFYDFYNLWYILLRDNIEKI